ncbi:Os12g0132900, partial [Oryza sativa Japonica Group]
SRRISSLKVSSDAKAASCFAAGSWVQAAEAEQNTVMAPAAAMQSEDDDDWLLSFDRGNTIKGSKVNMSPMSSTKFSIKNTT